MKIRRTCDTCEFDMGGICGGDGIYEYGAPIEDYNTECDGWGASFEYFGEVMKEAPWYINALYNKRKIDFDQFLELIDKDSNGEPIEINIYDAIEKIFEINYLELSVILNVSNGVVKYAKYRGTTDNHKIEFANKLQIPVELFDTVKSTELHLIEEAKKKFQILYGANAINEMKKPKNVSYKIVPKA